MILEDKPSIDLLLALLTFVAWSVDQFINKTANLSRFMQLAMSVVFDLCLNKPAPYEGLKPMFSLSRGYKGHDVNEEDMISLDTPRAVLGCFVLSSVYVILFHPKPQSTTGNL